MNDEALQSAVNAKTQPVYLASKAEIVEYYQDLQTEGKVRNWRVAAAQALAGTTDKHSKEYSAAIRQFQGSRVNQAGARLAPRYQAVGQQLPPIGRRPIGDSITIAVRGTQKAGPKGGTRDRTITVTFAGADAQAFANNPDYRDIWEMYGVDADLFDEGDYAIEVYWVG